MVLNFFRLNLQLFSYSLSLLKCLDSLFANCICVVIKCQHLCYSFVCIVSYLQNACALVQCSVCSWPFLPEVASIFDHFLKAISVDSAVQCCVACLTVTIYVCMFRRKLKHCLLLLLSCPACYALSLAGSRPIRRRKRMISAVSTLISSLWDRNVSCRSWLRAGHFDRCDAQNRYGTSWPDCPSKTRGVVAFARVEGLVWRVWYFLGLICSLTWIIYCVLQCAKVKEQIQQIERFQSEIVKYVVCVNLWNVIKSLETV